MEAAAKTPRPGRRRSLQQSLTLLRLFLVASAGILVVGGVALGWMLERTVRSQALEAERTSLTEYVDGVIRPRVVRNDRVVPTQAGIGQLRTQPDVVSVKVWRSDGTLAWTNRGRDRIGKRFPLEDELGDAIKDNETVADVIPTGDEGEHALEASLGFSHLYEIYAPIASRDGSHAIGAYEIYADPAAVDALIGSRVKLIWLSVGGVFLALFVALVLLVRHASRTLRRQTEELRDRAERLLDSYRRLEESSLEAVESLNATVDAKDPYTAGHSQRVERIAVAIGSELGLDSSRLEALHFAGLFHDIGKIAVPDAILTKPARLTPEEFEVIKRHPEDGAAIVARLARLREAVPLILYHHERWDGKGYPYGLAGDVIPHEAAIVGLADAWDAMTTDRPYSRAKTIDEAASEIRNGRGTQFAPSVVDAFFAALRRRPEQFTPDEPRGGATVALVAS